MLGRREWFGGWGSKDGWLCGISSKCCLIVMFLVVMLCFLGTFSKCTRAFISVYIVQRDLSFYAAFCGRHLDLETIVSFYRYVWMGSACWEMCIEGCYWCFLLVILYLYAGIEIHSSFYKQIHVQ
jgi:hypothetical protein